MRTKTILALGVATTVVCLGTVVVVEAATPAPARAATARFAAQCSTSNGWVGYCLDADTCVDAWTMDTNGNGRPDRLWFDLDGAVDGEDCAVDSYAVDDNESDGLLQYVQFDMDENQVPEASVATSFTLEGWIQQVTCVDTNGNGLADETCSVDTSTTLGPPTYDGLSSVLLMLADVYGVVIL